MAHSVQDAGFSIEVVEHRLYPAKIWMYATKNNQKLAF